MMNVRIFFSSVALVGCAATAPQGEPTRERRVDFVCANGESIQMRFFPLHGVAVLVRDGKTRELQEQRAASGFWYADDAVTVRGKGNDLLLTAAGGVPLHCVARP